MSTKFAAKKAQSVWVEWADAVSFDVAVLARRHTQTSLQTTPMTVEYAEIPQEPTDCRTQTGNTEFIYRDIPPAEAA